MRHAARVCSQPGCPNIAVEGGRCARHQLAEAPRPYAYFAQYGGDWPQISARFLRDNPYCVMCGGLATQTDHIVPLAEGGTHDEANLQPLCRACHSSKSAREQGGRHHYDNVQPACMICNSNKRDLCDEE